MSSLVSYTCSCAFSAKCDQVPHPDIFLGKAGNVYELEYEGARLFVQVHKVIAGCQHLLRSSGHDSKKYAVTYGTLVSPFFSTKEEPWLEHGCGDEYAKRGNIGLQFNHGSFDNNDTWDLGHVWPNRRFVGWLEKDEHIDFDFHGAAEHTLFQVCSFEVTELYLSLVVFLHSRIPTDSTNGTNGTKQRKENT